MHTFAKRALLHSNHSYKFTFLIIMEKQNTVQTCVLYSKNPVSRPITILISCVVDSLSLIQKVKILIQVIHSERASAYQYLKGERGRKRRQGPTNAKWKITDDLMLTGQVTNDRVLPCQSIKYFLGERERLLSTAHSGRQHVNKRLSR